MAAPLRAEVLVVGGGIAGAMAAIAARRRGAEVVLVRRALGATALSSGALDIAPDPLATPPRPRGQELSLEACVHHLAGSRPHHPYATLQAELARLPEVLAFAEEAFPGLGLVSPIEPNRCLPTPMGTLKFSGGALDSVIGGDLSLHAERIGVVGFRHHLEYDAALWARMLQDACARAGLSRTFLPVECDFLARGDDAILRPFEIAARIDDDPGALVRCVRAALPTGVERLLFPPVLSRRSPAQVLDLVESSLYLPAAESLATRLSVHGLRLQAIVDEALRREEVEVVSGEVRAARPRELDSLEIHPATPSLPPTSAFRPGGAGAAEEDEGRPVRAGAVVLATGKYLAGGLRKNGAVFEPLMDLPVSLPGPRRASSYRLTAHDLADEQPFFEAGLRTDARLRPVDEAGLTIDDRLHVCGDLLAGHDPARDGSAMGVALMTGYLAGRWAALVAAGEV